MERLMLLLVATALGVALLGCSRNTSGPSRPQAASPNGGQPAAESHGHAAEAAVDRISIPAAQAAVQKGDAVFVDVRQASAYQTGHIDGALSLPESEIPTRAALLPKGKKIITYCS